MSLTWFLNLLIVFFLILANGLFAMTELALLSSSREKLEQFEKNGHKSASIALAFLERPTDLLSSVQVGITLIGIINGAFGGATLSRPVITFLASYPAISPYAQTIGYTLVISLITYISLVIGELVPKRIALVSPERVTLLAARPMRLFSTILRPFIALLSWSTHTLFKWMGLEKLSSEDSAEDEVRQLLARGLKEGTFEAQEAEQVSRVFAFHDQYAYELMKPRTVIEWIDLNDSKEAIAETLRTSRHRKLPVGREDLDHFLGYVDAKEVLANETIDSLASSIKKPYLVPRQLKASTLLQEMRKEGKTVAYVLDEYGGFLGLITLFDILEAFVGEIETDEPPELILRDDGSFLADGLLHIDDLKRRLGIESSLPGEEDNAYHTVAGLVLYRLGHFPKRGESITTHGYRFEVVDLDGRRIDQILIEKTD